MTFLINIFFILELFVAVVICLQIIKLDKKVNEMSELIYVSRHNLKYKLRSVMDSIQEIKRTVYRKKKFLLKKRKEMIDKIMQGLLFTLMFAFLKKEHKKNILLFEIILILYNTYKADCKV